MVKKDTFSYGLYCLMWFMKKLKITINVNVINFRLHMYCYIFDESLYLNYNIHRNLK